MQTSKHGNQQVYNKSEYLACHVTNRLMKFFLEEDDSLEIFPGSMQTNSVEQRKICHS